MKGINQAPVGLMTWAMGRLLPKLVDFLKQEHNLQTSMKKDLLESLERQLRRMDAIQFKMSQEKQDQLDPHNSHYWAIDAWELSYDIEDTIDNLLLLCVEDGSEPKDSVMETLDDIKARVKNLAASNSPAGDFVATTSSSTIVYPCIEDGFKEVSQLIGIHELTGEVKTMMASSHELKTVSVCGPRGMGKTTLAKAVYDSFKGDFQCSAFVSLGLQPDMKKALRDILIDLAKERYSDLNKAILDERQLIDELRHLLKNKRYGLTTEYHLHLTKYPIYVLPPFQNCSFVMSKFF
jgi:disease resistance protein RPM1